MPIKVVPRPGEKIQLVMKRLKKICEKEGVIKEMRRQESYEKPSDKRRRAKMRSIKNAQRAREELNNPQQ